MVQALGLTEPINSRCGQPQGHTGSLQSTMAKTPHKSARRPWEGLQLGVRMSLGPDKRACARRWFFRNISAYKTMEILPRCARLQLVTVESETLAGTSGSMAL